MEGRHERSGDGFVVFMAILLVLAIVWVMFLITSESGGLRDTDVDGESCRVIICDDSGSEVGSCDGYYYIRDGEGSFAVSDAEGNYVTIPFDT